MESYLPTHSYIRAFNLRSRTSEFLPEVLPLLEADTHWEHMHRRTDTTEILQLAWQKGAERDTEYAKLCLTLTKRALSLTIATDYKINSQPNNLSVSTLVIDESSHTALHSIHRYNKLRLGYTEGVEAIDSFKIDFTNTLIGLGYKDAAVKIQDPAVIGFAEYEQDHLTRRPAA